MSDYSDWGGSRTGGRGARRCESCSAPAEVSLADDSSWCRACDDAARRLGYDDDGGES